MIELNSISKTFISESNEKTQALKNVSLQFKPNDFIIIVGANGSGKSTLLNALAGNTKIDSGTILFDGVDVTHQNDFERSKYISRVFQNPLLGTIADLSIAENFRLAKLRGEKKTLQIGLNKSFESEIKLLISTLEMGLENKINLKMGSLSGGQRQALTLLMSVLAESKLLLLDEPTAALDPKSSEIVLKTAQKIVSEKNLTAILVTHQLKDAFVYGNRIIQMEAGAIKRDVNAEEKSKLQLNHLFEWFA